MPHPKILCKKFFRSHLDYGDIIYEQVYDSSFHQKIESVQYNECLAITEAINSTSKEKILNEIGPDSLQLCRWIRKLCYFYKFYKK